jgi:hypothetical protein
MTAITAASTQKDYDYIVSSISCQALLKGAADGAPFNGVMFGLYAFADGEPCSDPAYFSDILMVKPDGLNY